MLQTLTARAARSAEWTLGVLGAAVCVTVAVVFIFTLQATAGSPLAYVYLIEIAFVGMLGLLGIAHAPERDPGWSAVPWIASGILWAFVVLGIFSVGLFVLPAAVAFLAAALLASRPLTWNVLRQLMLLVLVALTQGSVMWSLRTW